jgi:hypothetical protein
VRLIQNLAPGQQPVLRIGGDSADHTWWPVRGQAQPRGASYPLSSDWLAVARALAAALGAKLVLGVNLAAGDPAVAAAEAAALRKGIGSRYIEAFEVGNEPDLYGRDPWYRAPDGKVSFARPRTYSFQAFLDDFSRWRQTLAGLPLAGPAFAWLPWMNDLGQFIGSEPGVRLVTFHRYPLRRCNQSASSPLFGSIPNLMSSFSSSGLAAPLARYAAVAHTRGLGFRIDELNSVSCHGKPGVSDAFASALWALDTLFNFAKAGVDGVNIHTFPGASYQLFNFQKTGVGWTASVKPEYYGLEMFAQAAPPGARLLQITGSTGPVRPWATVSPDGTERVVLINSDAQAAHTVLVRLAGIAGAATLERLTAPGAGATRDVSLGGQSYGPETTTGELTGRDPQPFLLPSSSGYLVELPAASAATLTLFPGLSAEPLAK